MSVLIKGMEMPKSCGFCRLRHADQFQGDACSVKVGLWCEFQKRPEDCPLIPVPPHGRLIDGDLLPWRLANTDVKYASYEDWEKLCDYIRAAPTIISAEEGE